MRLPIPAPVRRLGLADLKACLALSADRGWSPEEHKWTLLLDAAEGYGIDDPDGGLAGSVVLARYGTELASVGMMLVASRYGRQGLGRQLMAHLLERAGDAAVFLTATSYGRPLYEKLGFRVTGRSATFLGRFQPDAGLSAAGIQSSQMRAATAAGLPSQTRAATAADFEAIVRIDRPAFGADREYLLQRLFGFSDQVRVLTRNGRIAGYASTWRNIDVTVIGPLIAPDAAAAQALITSLAQGVEGPVRLDVYPARRDIADWLAARGLLRVAETAFMVRGPWPPPGDHDQLFCPLTVALG